MSPRRNEDESSRLIDRPADEEANAGLFSTKTFFVLGACLAYIAMSSCLINYNKFLMHKDVFPYSVALTSLHMGGSFFFSLILYAIFGSSWFPAVATVKENPAIMKKFAPLSLAFALSICLSNEAYLYCSVPFLQMCKELNVVLVYVVGLALFVEKFNVQTASILLVIMMGCCMSIHGEMRFSMTGFAFQICGQVMEVVKIVMQQLIMQGFKVDPLTMVLCMAPLCLCSLLFGLYFFWVPGIVVAAQTHWVHLVFNCLNAFALNVCVATVIKHASGVSFVLCGVVKDCMIVLSAAYLFSANVTGVQLCGFSVAVAGVACHSMLRSMPDMAAKHGVGGTLWFALTGRNPEKSSEP